MEFNDVLGLGCPRGFVTSCPITRGAQAVSELRLNSFSETSKVGPVNFDLSY